LLIADAQTIPIRPGAADVINCCGPVLSFVPDWRGALQEMGRIIAPGGRLLLEVEGKWTFDVFWTLLSTLVGDPWGYRQSLWSSARRLLPPYNRGHTIRFAFPLEDGTIVDMPLKLFAFKELRDALADVDLRLTHRWGVHSLTNLIPSQVLHSAEPSRRVRDAFNKLASIERRYFGRWPLRSLGCSLLVIAERAA
jgi:SAM-dependent methyltransferase